MQYVKVTISSMQSLTHAGQINSEMVLYMYCIIIHVCARTKIHLHTLTNTYAPRTILT